MKTKWMVTVFILSALLPMNNLWGSELLTKYYPLKEGMSWEFSILADKGEKRTIMITNLAPREISGKTATPRKWDMGGASKYYFIATDDYGVYRYAEQPSENAEPTVVTPKVYYLRNPVDNGTTWDIVTKLGGEDLTINLTIESINDTVKTPAGTFKDCVKIKHAGGGQKGDAATSVTAYEWYAPEVGLVKSIVTIKKLEKGKETSSEHLTYQLESFKK